MRISFKKEVIKPSILTCIRDNGSRTWVKMHPGIEPHDLGHYAVEIILGFENAFYGMVAKGTNIEDFELPREKRPKEALPSNLHAEALISEHLVNLLMVKAQSQGLFKVLDSLRTILEQNDIPFPEQLNEDTMKNICDLFQKLLKSWTSLKTGETLELNF